MPLADLLYCLYINYNMPLSQQISLVDIRGALLSLHSLWFRKILPYTGIIDQTVLAAMLQGYENQQKVMEISKVYKLYIDTWPLTCNLRVIILRGLNPGIKHIGWKYY